MHLYRESRRRFSLTCSRRWYAKKLGRTPGKHEHQRVRTCRGGVLFEVVLAVALFGGAAVFALSAARNTLASLERMRLQQAAIDLAKSKLAELEAGLITLGDLRDSTGEDEQWTFDLRTSRSEFTDLTLIELTVRQNTEETEFANPMSFTLRQLVALKGAGE